MRARPGDHTVIEVKATRKIGSRDPPRALKALREEKQNSGATTRSRKDKAGGAETDRVRLAYHRSFEKLWRIEILKAK